MHIVALAIHILLFGIPAGQAGSEPLSPRDPAALADGRRTDEANSLGGGFAAARRAVFAIEGGYEARNPGQQWTTLFDGRGFTTIPFDGDWSWGLELQRYGWSGAEFAPRTPLAVSAGGERVAYQWDDVLTEWYLNGSQGLEHGYTVHLRPAQAGGALTLDLSIRGGLAATASSDGRSVGFRTTAGDGVLDYAGLTVFDACGDVLDSRLEVTPLGIRLSVEDRGAAYPLTIDPVAQKAYLKAAGVDSDDLFGCAVAISGDTAVIGARQEDSWSVGPDGDPGSNGSQNSGAAYVFVRNGASWVKQAYLKASNTGKGDNFGSSVAISGDTLVVGAPEEDSNATSVNGDTGNDLANAAGAAYVFVRNGQKWSQQAYLKGSNTESTDLFGYSVGVSGNTIIVGAIGEDSDASGVNGDPWSDAAPYSGAAYVFVRSGTTWSQQAYLKASTSSPSSDFGCAVAIAGNTAVVGAFGADEAAPDAGSAYVYMRSGTSWGPPTLLKASNAGPLDFFGSAVSVSGNTVVVGAPREDSNAKGANGNQNDDSSPDAGAAYVFVPGEAGWSQQAYLKASNTESNDIFGGSVSLSGNMLVVGAMGEDSNGAGLLANQNSNTAANAGAAYVFVRSGTSWIQSAYLKPFNTDPYDSFGCAVAASGPLVVVGSRSEDSAVTGSSGDPENNGASSAGASYAFDVPPPVFEVVSGCQGNPAILWSTSTNFAIGQSTSLNLIAAKNPTGLGLYYLGVSVQDAAGCGVALPGIGELLLGLAPLPVRLGFSLTLGGVGQFLLNVPNTAALVGEVAAFQAANLDLSASGAPLELSNALTGVIRP